MKPQEAIGIMKIAISEVEWEYPMAYPAAFETAIEALEKQIPKKPNYVYEDEPLCPYCGAVLDDCESPCENCNQFIDWSDSDD